MSVCRTLRYFEWSRQSIWILSLQRPLGSPPWSLVSASLGKILESAHENHEIRREATIDHPGTERNMQEENSNKADGLVKGGVLVETALCGAFELFWSLLLGWFYIFYASTHYANLQIQVKSDVDNPQKDGTVELDTWKLWRKHHLYRWYIILMMSSCPQ